MDDVELMEDRKKFRVHAEIWKKVEESGIIRRDMMSTSLLSHEMCLQIVNFSPMVYFWK